MEVVWPPHQVENRKSLQTLKTACSDVDPPPPSRNSYLEYKRDNAQIIRWIITTASNIKRRQEKQERKGSSDSTASQPPSSPPSSKAAEDNPSKPQLVKIDSPAITVASLISLSELIAKSEKTIPTTVFRLFRYVINARTSAYQFWASIYAGDPDVEIKKANKAHKAFLDALNTAYKVLGGPEWEEREAEERKQKPGDEVTDDHELANRFEGLEVAMLSSDGEASNNPDKPAPQRAQRKNKKGKGKKKKPTAAPEPKPQEWPLEDFKLKDDPGAETEAVFGAFCFLKDMVDLRRYTASLWRQVAEDELHIAVAGALSNVAVARESNSFTAEFSQFSSFDNIIHIFCRGDLEGSTGKLKFAKIGPLGTLETTVVDFREHFCIYAHEDLTRFITDYRINRNGKPSPAYVSLRWDPNLGLGTLSAQKRRQWRSDFSMLWFYDFVNSYASTLLTRAFQPKTLETWDWSIENMGRQTRRMLWGPVEFVSEIATLAMKRKDAPLARLIKPHHVFQTQVMLDSMTAFRGWHLDVMIGDSVSPPKPWEQIFTEMDSFKSKCLKGTSDLAHEYMVDQERYGDPRRHKYPIDEIKNIMTEIQLVLGDTMLSRAEGAPASRFEYIKTNGMWAYNPWLCGTGLAEAMNFVYDFGISAWDKSGLALCIFHLYNMFLATGHIPEGKFNIMEDLLTVFGNDLFTGGKRPKKNFFKSWMLAAGVKAQVLADPRKKRMNRGGNVLDSGERMSSLYRRAEIRCFHRKSLLRALQDEDWIPERLPKERIPIVNDTSAAQKERRQKEKVLFELMRRSENMPSDKVKINHPEKPDEDFLLSLRRALILDINGSVPNGSLNLSALLGFFMQVFEKLDEGTNHFPRPLGPPVGPTPAVHNNVMKLALDLEVEGKSLEGNEVLAKMGKIFVKYVAGVELGDFVFVDWIVDVD